jgi:hypothetical protein
MTKNPSPADLLAQTFLQKAREISSDVEPIRVLKARAYKILDTNMLIRAASAGKTRRYFFGLNYIHAEEVANLDNPFFVFVCGSIDQTIILPAHVLVENLPVISHDRNGEYKIIFDADLNLVLAGKKNRLNCANFVNAWHLIEHPPQIAGGKSTAEESLHSVLQGRLLEIGRIRGLQTFCPNKSKKFNGRPLSELATLNACPQLQFSEYNLLRQIDVLWFRERGQNHIPECAFEVELSTGTWSGVGRMATLLDYADTRLYVISDEAQKYDQVMNTFADFRPRYKHIPLHLVGELYAAELGLRELRTEIGL